MSSAEVKDDAEYIPQYVPLRKCVACGARSPKSRLIRVAMDSLGRVQLDSEGKLPGRGAYVCRSDECIKRTVSKHALDRSFRRSIDGSVYTGLECIGNID